MIRSSRFGSIRSDIVALFRLAFAWAPEILLNPATSYKSPAHSSTGTRSDIVYPPTACQLTVSCSFSLPYGGSISPFHHCTSSLSVTQEYLALQGGPRRFTRDSTCPMLLGIISNLDNGLTTGLSPSMVQDSTASPSNTTLTLLPHNPVLNGLGYSHFARRYYGNRFCFLFLWLLRCFSSPGCLLPAYEFSSSSKG